MTSKKSKRKHKMLEICWMRGMLAYICASIFFAADEVKNAPLSIWKKASKYRKNEPIHLTVWVAGESACGSPSQFPLPARESVFTFHHPSSAAPKDVSYPSSSTARFISWPEEGTRSSLASVWAYIFFSLHFVFRLR